MFNILADTMLTATRNRSDLRHPDRLAEPFGVQTPTGAERNRWRRRGGTR
ncbi:hypothetical protein [Stappia sp.]